MAVIVPYATVMDCRNGPPGVKMDFSPFGRDYCFVSRLIDFQEATSGANAFVVAEYDFTGRKAWEKSHFVGNPLMAGNHQSECGDQATALLGMLDPRLKDRAFVLGSKKARFPRMVPPGTTLVIRSELLRVDNHGGRAAYQIWVKGSPRAITVSAEITFVFPKKR